MRRFRQISEWVVLVLGALGVIACIASIFVVGSPATWLLACGFPLSFLGAAAVASRMTGLPLLKPADTEEPRPILAAALQFGLGLFWSYPLLSPDSYMAHSAFTRVAWVHFAIVAIWALVTVGAAYRLACAIMHRWKARLSAG